MRGLIKSLLSGNTATPTATPEEPEKPVLPGRLEQTEAKFESENVGLFLHWVNANSDIRLPEAFIDDVLYDLPDIALNTNKAFTTGIELASQPDALRINIFMEGVDAPDVYFFGSEAVVQEMDKAIRGFLSELGNI